jgi:signal transduction histidine kinase
VVEGRDPEAPLVDDAGATKGADPSAGEPMRRSTETETEAAGDRAALERRIRELERENDRLEGRMKVLSHDLRNVLSVAVSHLELAREKRDGEHLRAVARSNERMEELLEDLLASREVGLRVDDAGPVSLADCAHRSWRAVDTERAELVVESSRWIVADADRLTQLLENLFHNSVEHGPTEGSPEVTVAIGVRDDGAGFFVEDDGRGLTNRERDRIFEEGFSTAEDGTGLGLSIVSEVVDRHGWSMEAKAADSGGARFEISDVELPARTPSVGE